MNAISETIDEALVIINKEGKVITWNKKAEELYNIPAEKIISQPIQSFFDPKDLMITRVIEDQKEVCNTYHQPCKGTHILINAKPIIADNEIIGGVCADRDITELVCLHKELQRISSRVRKIEVERKGEKRDAFKHIIGHSQRLKKAISLSRRIAKTDTAVILRGETGTGKDLFAEAIHYESIRQDGPLININCGAIPHALFESELFGYQAGAFTGADRKGKLGKFELANGGTIFLDEVGELPLEMQTKLLRVLQNKMFYRIGGSESIHVDFRVIAATNQDLEKMIAEGRFRQDLYYRLNVFTIEIPPLRERREDIPELIQYFVQEFSQKHHRSIVKVTSEIMSMLLTYSWPGNVRELRNIIERLVVLAEDDEMGAECLPFILHHNNKGDLAGFFSNITEQTARDIIITALERYDNNIAQTAKFLGIPRSTLYYKIRTLGINKLVKIKC